jgi:hypothetical protein
VTAADPLSPAEWAEMDALRSVLAENPASVAADRMERFTSLLLRSWPVQGDVGTGNRT